MVMRHGGDELKLPAKGSVYNDAVARSARLMRLVGYVRRRVARSVGCKSADRCALAQQHRPMSLVDMCV